MQLVRELPHPVEKVWRAITLPELVAEWLLPGDFRAEPGHVFTFDASVGAIACEVLEAEPPRRLVYSWRALDLDSTVTIELAPQNGGTRLTLSQTGFTPEQTRAFHGARAGWGNFLDRLDRLMTEGDAR